METPLHAIKRAVRPGQQCFDGLAIFREDSGADTDRNGGISLSFATLSQILAAVCPTPLASRGEPEQTHRLQSVQEFLVLDNERAGSRPPYKVPGSPRRGRDHH